MNKNRLPDGTIFLDDKGFISSVLITYEECDDFFCRGVLVWDEDHTVIDRWDIEADSEEDNLDIAIGQGTPISPTELVEFIFTFPALNLAFKEWRRKKNAPKQSEFIL